MKVWNFIYLPNILNTLSVFTNEMQLFFCNISIYTDWNEIAQDVPMLAWYSAFRDFALESREQVIGAET